MKALLILICVFLTACATKEKTTTILKVQAPFEIMLDCEDFKIVDNPSFASFITTSVENKKIYELCKSQNKAKKDFIINTTR